VTTASIIDSRGAALCFARIRIAAATHIIAKQKEQSVVAPRYYLLLAFRMAYRVCHYIFRAALQPLFILRFIVKNSSLFTADD